MLLNETLYNLIPYTPGEQPDNPNVIKLNTNENPFPPSPNIRRAVEKILDGGLLRKYPNPTSKKLRELIADIEKVDADNVLVTNGSDEGLSLIFRATLPANSVVVCPYPTYSLYPVLTDMQMNGSSIVKVPLKDDLHFDMDNLAKTKGNLLCFANPNAPTGLLEPKESLTYLVKNFRGVVLCDEAYIDFAPKGSSMVSEIHSLENLIVSRTLSKSYSLAGLRVGYLVASKQIISLLNKLKDSYNVGMLEQAIAYEAIQDRAYLEKTSLQIISNRKYLTEKLLDLGFSVVPSSTNFIFTKPPVGVHPKELFHNLEKSNIYIRYFTDSISKDYLRITVGTIEECNILVDTIKTYL